MRGGEYRMQKNNIFKNVSLLAVAVAVAVALTVGGGGGGNTVVAAGRLNDTGIILCADYVYATGGSNSSPNADLDCSTQATVPTQTTDGFENASTGGDVIPLGQDALFGRDVTHNNSLDGHAGYSFTKLDENGNDLGAFASTWSCIKDNVTGLIWEVKTGLSARTNAATYTWHNTDTTNNGGDSGVQRGGACLAGDCDTQGYVVYVNNLNGGAGLCGATDWRLPNRLELKSIVLHNVVPTVDANYFPNTTTGTYWSSSPYAADINNAWSVSFSYGSIEGFFEAKSKSHYVRLVRGGG